MTPALEVRALSLRFGAVEALDEVTFEVAVGELFALIGPNGAGKTSLFNLLSRTYAPTSGTVRYFGEASWPCGPTSWRVPAWREPSRTWACSCP